MAKMSGYREAVGAGSNNCCVYHGLGKYHPFSGERDTMPLLLQNSRWVRSNRIAMRLPPNILKIGLFS